MDAERQQREAVLAAYSERAKKRERWFNKYDLGLQISKMLCDYSLLGRIDMLDKTVLNIGCSGWRSTLDRQHLIVAVGRSGAVGLEGDQVRVEQPIAGHLEFTPIQAENVTDLLFAIEADAVAVGREHQEQVEDLVLMGHDLQIAVA